MKPRANYEEICKSIAIDTKDIIENYIPNLQVVETQLSWCRLQTDLYVFLQEEGKASSSKIMSDLREAFVNIETMEDFQNCLAINLKLGYGDMSLDGTRLDMYMEKNTLCFELYLSDNQDKPRFSIKGKPSRVIAKVLGEKLATKFCSKYSINKPDKFEVHFSRSYIPELYFIISQNESISSCMSHPSDRYGLPDDLHPVMCYEGSPNAVLGLLFDVSKQKYVARAIVALDLHGKPSFAMGYGRNAATKMFQEAGLLWEGNMDGLKLSKLAYNDQLLAPYVDGDDQRLTDDGCWLVVDCDGELLPRHETGRISSLFCCPCCLSDVNPDYNVYIDSEDREVCSSCAASYYVCLHDGTWASGDDAVYVDEQCEYYMIDECTYCDWSDQWYANRDHNFYTVETNRHTYTVVDDDIDDAIAGWDVTEIDGEELIDWLIANRDYEPETEEEAA